MILCFECNQPADHNHHVVPRSLGGTKTVPLCEGCHGKVHGKRFLNHRTLIRAGLKRAKAQGKVLGRPRIDPAVEAQIVSLRKTQRLGMRAIARALKVGNCTVQRVLASTQRVLSATHGVVS